jgi:hypothetical protein
MSERTFGRAYETPVDTIPGKTGLLIDLPYGTRADRPSFVATADVKGQIPGKTLRTLRLFGVNQCLHLEKS